MYTPQLTCAPMEGLTTVVFRQVHARVFGCVDRYYIPFVTPTREPRFTERQMRELSPEANSRFTAIPQLLTRSVEDFVWAAKSLRDMGYEEVNLNLGCPAGTVTAKGKGSGFLRTPTELETFLERIFEADLMIGISIKTRLGWSNTEEFEDLARIYARFPLTRLIVHARLKTDLYKGDARSEIVEAALPLLPVPYGCNGDIVTPADIENAQKRGGQAPGGLAEIMVGRALMADPALFRKARSGRAAALAEILAFSDELFETYAERFESRKNALMRLKEYWFYQSCLFGRDDEDEAVRRASSRLFRCKEPDDFQAALRDFTSNFELRRDARFGWRKSL